MICLTNDEQNTVISLLKTYATDQPYTVDVFGSRAMGTAKKYSDVDIALKGRHAVPMQTLASLNESLENSNLPCTVDVVDYQCASLQLQSQIDQHGLPLVTV